MRYLLASILTFGSCLLCLLTTGPIRPAAAAVNAEELQIRDVCVYGSGTEAIASCEALLLSDPENVALLLRYADHFIDLQQFDAAEKAVKKVLELDPRSEKALYKLKEIESYLEEKKWADTRSDAMMVKQGRAALSPQLKLEKIRCLKLKGEKALQACSNLLKALGHDHGLYLARGRILMDLGRSEEAEREFLLAAEHNPSFKDPGAEKNDLSAQKQKSSSGDSQPLIISSTKKKRVLLFSPIHREEVDSKEKNVSQKKVLAAGSDSGYEKTTDPRLSVENEGGSWSPVNDFTEKMMLLNSLYEKSLIDREEFESRKKKLLDSIIPLSEKIDTDLVKQPAHIDPLKLGKYHALVIGIQDYTGFPKLETPLKDANDVSAMLKEQYGFNVMTLINPSRRDIILALQEYRKKLEFSDNLLIYYAGHGWLDEEADAGYWLPVEAVPENDVDWLSLSSLVSAVRAVEAKHVLVVADSCFSGKLTRGVRVARPSPSHYDKIAKKRARVVITSGGLEPVLDSGGREGNSVFADAFLQALRQNEGIMDGATLFTKIRRPVMLKAQQTPQYSDIRRALHEGGDFIFRKNADGQ